METENDLQKPQKPTKKINMGYIFGIFMILIYFGMAYLLIFTPLFENTFSEIFLRLLKKNVFSSTFLLFSMHQPCSARVWAMRTPVGVAARPP